MRTPRLTRRSFLQSAALAAPAAWALGAEAAPSAKAKPNIIPYGPKTQPDGRSCFKKGLQDSPKQWVRPVTQHFETVESPL